MAILANEATLAGQRLMSDRWTCNSGLTQEELDAMSTVSVVKGPGITQAELGANTCASVDKEQNSPQANQTFRSKRVSRGGLTQTENEGCDGSGSDGCSPTRARRRSELRPLDFLMSGTVLQNPSDCANDYGEDSSPQARQLLANKRNRARAQEAQFHLALDETS
mmetsp:Transcript_120679/g.341237  ORF Transcript_120679/g.341237 Transcript_120679/m.341237 type:complete len:165 (+) Transcript_120679:81-575(+)|eukprot:CAMPEP_0117581834 /NCGR_PEP_ID=MMETSP0784-20121206/66071_1 /TAXON_ID=39447 /ORGANISM="" /LENGTH=164 /DNA_ID=CAMNT_0005382237 /DNA_START=81 /DNA_END=575 /DNA_ORIENTATION=+